MKVYGSINTEANSEINTTPESPAISSNTLTIDCSKGNVFVINHNANITTLNVVYPNDGQAITILFNEASSGLTIAWPSNFFFLGSNVIDATSGQINQIQATYSVTLNEWVVTLSTNNGVGTGSVTSVALTDASTTPIFTVSGSPITTSGTLTLTLSTESANKVFAGPSSGSAAQPTFRSLVLADLPPPSYEAQTASNYAVLSTTSTSFVISGNFTSLFVSGYKFAVFGSTGGANDATWTVTSSTYASGPNQTTINVTGSVTTSLAANGTAAQIVFNTTIVGTITNTGTNTYMEVFVNGVYQEEGSSKAYTVTGANQITFTYGLSLNSDVAFIGFT